MVEKVQGEVVSVAVKNVKDESLDPVIKANATVVEDSALKKLWKGFFAESFSNVRKNIWKDVVVPSIKTGIANAFTTGIYMWLFGKNGYTGLPGGGTFKPYMGLLNSNNTIAYNSMYGSKVTTSSGPKVTVGDNNFGRYTSADVYNPEYIRYASFQDAMAVYEGLLERLNKYGVATVKNLYDLSGMSGYEMVLQNWGWYDFPTYKVLPIGDGTWYLKLPQPTALGGGVGATVK